MSLDRQKAIGILASLVEEQMRKHRLKGDGLALRAGVTTDIVTKVATGKADLCRECEIRKLIKVLFLARTKLRTRAFRLLLEVHPSRRAFQSMPYKNRKFFLQRKRPGVGSVALLR